VVARYIKHYNSVRLNSAIGYVAPLAKLEGRDTEIFKMRDRKLETAREARKKRRRQALSYREEIKGHLLINLN
jgi:hypothetical protein